MLAIFNSYVSLPEGMYHGISPCFGEFPTTPPGHCEVSCEERLSAATGALRQALQEQRQEARIHIDDIVI